eukprot:Rmarinus@m.8570
MGQCLSIFQKEPAKPDPPRLFTLTGSQKLRSYSVFRDAHAVDKTNREEAVRPKSKVVLRSAQTIHLKGTCGDRGMKLSYGFHTRKGSDPEEGHPRPNQDDFLVLPHVKDCDHQSLFGVFDGHGAQGELCSAYAAKNLPQTLISSDYYETDPKEAFQDACLQVNCSLNKIHVSKIDASFSGTTACVGWVIGRDLYVANLGDSRAILVNHDGSFQELSNDHTAALPSEKERVSACGAQVRTLAEMRDHYGWDVDDDDDTPRIWQPNKKGPGCAFTRSIGDSTAETIGVIAEPDVRRFRLDPQHHKAVLIATDGVWHFVSSSEAAEMVVTARGDALHVAKSIVDSARDRWIRAGAPADDVTVVLVTLEEEDLDNNEPASSTNTQAQEASPSDVNVSVDGEKKWAPSRRAAVTAEEDAGDGDVELEVGTPEEMTEEARGIILAEMDRSFLFSGLLPEQREGMLQYMRRIAVPAGARIIQQGDPADNLYIIESGYYDVFVKKGDIAESKVHAYDGKGSFGELALMYGTPRNASVVCRGSGDAGTSTEDGGGVLWALPRRTFRKLVIQSSSQSVSERLSFLQSVKTLEGLSLMQMQQLADALQTKTFSDAEVIIRENEPGNEFFIILSGEVVVTQEVAEGMSKELIRLQRGDHFGERALLTQEPRAATVTAVGTVTCLTLGRAEFSEMLGDLQEVLDRNYSRMVLRSIPMLKPLADSDVEKLLDILEHHEFRKGEDIIQEGDTGDRFYIISSGEVVCTSRAAAQSLKEKAGSNTNLIQESGSLELARLRRGDFFGERALLSDEPRGATVTAKSELVRCFSIGRNGFNNLLGPLQNIMDRRVTVNTMRTMPILAGLSTEDFQLLVPHFEMRWYEDGQYIIDQGAHGSEFFVIVEGQVRATLLREDGREETLATKRVGDYFGEMALLNDEPRVCNIVATDRVKVAMLHRSQFRKILGPLQELQARNKKKAAASGSAFSDKARAPVDLKPEDLVKVKILGKGTFGTVWLVQNTQNAETYAMKVLHKGAVVKMKQVDHLKKEKEVLCSLSHPFLLNMVTHYQDAARVYFVTPLLLGGELFTYLSNSGEFSEDTSRFYAACVVMGFEHLHSKRIIYRDLKPENILLRLDGYPVIVDFGFAKEVTDRTWTLCGTPDYLAPEIISTRGHSFPVDWWALGILIHEMITGCPPFMADDPMNTYRKIMSHSPKPVFRQMYSADAKDLVSRLLNPNPAQRLGSLRNGVEDIKSHPWFRTIDWAALVRKEVTPPIIPKVSDPTDTSNFCEYSDEEEPAPYKGNEFNDF